MAARGGVRVAPRAPLPGHGGGVRVDDVTSRAMRVIGGGRAPATEPLRITHGSVTAGALHVAVMSGTGVGRTVREEMKWARSARWSNGEGMTGAAGVRTEPMDHWQ